MVYRRKYLEKRGEEKISDHSTVDSSASGRKVKSGRRVEEPTNHHEGRGDVRGAKVTVIIVDEVYESTQLMSFLISINNKNAPMIFLQDRELLHKKEQRKRKTNQNHQHHIIIFALIKISWV